MDSAEAMDMLITYVNKLNTLEFTIHAIISAFLIGMLFIIHHLKRKFEKDVENDSKTVNKPKAIRGKRSRSSYVISKQPSNILMAKFTIMRIMWVIINVILFYNYTRMYKLL